MTTKRSLAYSGLLTVIVLVVASCGGQQFPTTQARPPETPATPQARLLAAVKRTTAARTARLAIDMSMSGLGEAGTVEVTGSGVMDLTHRSFMMKMQSSGVAAFSLEMRVVDGTAYVNAGDGWTSQAVSSADASTPVPTNYLDYLQGIAGGVRVLGHDTVRGVDTTRFGATIDLDRAMARVGTSAQRAAIRHVLQQFGLTEIPVTVWVDDGGRLRKMTMSMDLAAVADKLGAPSGVDPKIDVTFELYGFGLPVDVREPVGAKAFVAAPDRAAESDLRNALTAEKTTYTDNMTYSADSSLLKQIEPSLDWGGRLSVVVGGAQRVVCLSERSESGTTFAIADVAYGPRAGTYFATTGCPSVVNASSFSHFRTSW